MKDDSSIINDGKGHGKVSHFYSKLQRIVIVFYDTYFFCKFLGFIDINLQVCFNHFHAKQSLDDHFFSSLHLLPTLMAKKPMLKGPAAGAVARSTLRACV
jgi:hypothetical protein